MFRNLSSRELGPTELERKLIKKCSFLHQSEQLATKGGLLHWSAVAKIRWLSAP
jgi:hypothetical protein